MMTRANFCTAHSVKKVSKCAMTMGLAAAVASAIALGGCASQTSSPSAGGENASGAISSSSAKADTETMSTVADSVEANAQSIAVKASTEEYTWDELSRISEEISAAGTESGGVEVAKKYNLCYTDGTLDGTQTKSVRLSDGTEAKVQIVGFNQDDRSDGSGKAGITFLFVDCIDKHEMKSNGNKSTNAGGWRDSAMRSYLDEAVFDRLPSDLADVVVEVDKRTNNTGELDYLRYSSAQMVDKVTVTSDKLWLPSLRELSGAASPYSSYHEYDDLFAAEGEEYKLYRDMAVDPFDNNGANQVLVKSLDGKAVFWWERTPGAINNNGFVTVSAQGLPSANANSADAKGVVPGFCI